VTDGITIAPRPVESGCKNENLNVLRIIFRHICDSVVAVDLGPH